MNNERYKISEDRIDFTLYECFEDGKMEIFFNSKKHLNDWINKQNLKFMFDKNTINKISVKWLTKEKK